MTEHIDLDLTEAVEAAAMAVAKEANVDWYKCNLMVQLKLKEAVLPLVNAAAPFIIDQIWKDIESRRYEIKKEEL